MLQQRLDERAAAMHLQIGTGLSFELFDFLRDVTIKKDRWFPLMLRKRIGNNILRRLIDSGAFIRVVGPVGGKDLKCLPP